MAAAPNPKTDFSMDSAPQVELTPVHHSALAPLREPLFRSLWIAAVISYTGSWMQNVATGWLMSNLNPSPLWVSLVQVALSLPVFLIALPAGALADMIDRRKFLLVTQSSMVAAAAVLGVLTITGALTPQLLLVFTFLLGVGAVMNDPAWQSLTPDLVPPAKLPAAVALNSAGFNIARAVGLRYARQEPRIRTVLVRTLVFSLPASTFFALLPLIASKFGAEGFGAML